MIASSFQVLDYCDPDALFDVLDAKREIVFGHVDFVRLTELAEAGQLCAHVRGSRLRWIELIVPLSEVKPTERSRQIARSASDAIGQDGRTIIRGHDTMALHFDHNARICRAYGIPARMRQHQTAAAEARAARARVRNRPVAITFTQRASLADQIAI